MNRTADLPQLRSNCKVTRRSPARQQEESMTSGKGLKDAFAWRDDPYKESKLK